MADSVAEGALRAAGPHGKLRFGLAPTTRTPQAYDRLGVGYSAVRRADPRLASRIRAALGDARTVLNVGAGAGSYEPPDRWVLAVEPSSVMIAQRPPGSAPVLVSPVEKLPLADNNVDAATAIFTLHHWHSLETGLAELLRVVRDRIVLLTMDIETLAEVWLARDYLPELLGGHADRFPSIARLCESLPNPKVEAVPIPHDCRDGFMVAFWARPTAYLDPAIRAATSPWHDLPESAVERALEKLRRGPPNRRVGTALRRAAETDRTRRRRPPDHLDEISGAGWARLRR